MADLQFVVSRFVNHVAKVAKNLPQ